MAAESTRQLGENIRSAREALGLTQELVAREMEGQVTGDRVSKWERGENRPRDETLDDLARVLKTTVPALLYRDQVKEETPSPFAGRDDRLDVLEQKLDAIMVQNQQILSMLVAGEDITDRLDRLQEALTETVDEGAKRLEESVAEARRVLRAGSQDPKPTAPKRAAKRTRAA